MYAVLCNSVFLKEIEQAITLKGEEILFKAVDDDIDILDSFEKVSRTPVKHLIIDISAIQDTKKLLLAVKRYRIRNDKTQIIIIAPNVTPPNTFINALVTMGIYDILAPGGEKLEDIVLLPSLLDILESPYTYKKSVKWFLDTDINADIQDSLDVLPKSNKNDKEIIERTLTITREKIIGTVVIAVAGTMNRVGTTHSALTIAEFLKNSNFKVALLELHNSRNFIEIKRAYKDIREEENHFIYNGISYFPYTKNIDLLDVLQKEYNYIILDMGTYNTCDISEFKRANLKVIVSGAKDWEISPLETILKSQDLFNLKKYNYYFTFCDKSMFELINENMGQLKCYQAAYNPNPFLLTTECSSCLKKLLKEVLPEVKQTDNNKSLFSKLIRKKGEKA